MDNPTLPTNQDTLNDHSYCQSQHDLIPLTVDDFDNNDDNVNIEENYHGAVDNQFPLEDPNLLNLQNIFVEQLNRIKELVCIHCKEQHFITQNTPSQTCPRCRQPNQRNKYLSTNNMNPGEMVPELTGLTPVEQLLIAQDKTITLLDSR